MKILFITNFFPPTHTAGTENYTYGITHGLLEAGYEVQVLCAGQWGVGKQYWNGHTDETYNDVPVRRLHINWTKAPDPNLYLYDNPIIATYLREYLTQIQPDIVHITSCYTLSSSVIRVAKEADLPVVVTLTDFWFLCPRLNLLRGNGELCDGRTTDRECLSCMLWDERVYSLPSQILPGSLVDNVLTWASHHPSLARQQGFRGMAMNMRHRKTILPETLALADYVIAPSEFLKEVFLQNCTQIPIHVIPYGHDLSWLQSYTGKKPSSIMRFGYMGQISRIKGVHVLLNAFNAIAVDGQATLSIFGGLNKQQSYIQEVFQIAAGNPAIQFKGAFARENISEVLAQIDILVVPSIWYENNPLVIQEAFAANTPVIATNLGGMSQFVQHEISGLLFERGSASDLTQQLQRVLTDSELLEQLQAGILDVRRVEEEVGELVDIYNELINRETV